MNTDTMIARILLIPVVILRLLPLVACGRGQVAAPTVSVPTATAKGSDLVGSSWLVEDISRRGVIDDAQTTMSFSEPGRVQGSTVCNSYTGSVTIANASMQFGPMAVTMRMCHGPLANQEAGFVEAVAQVSSHELDEERGLLFLYTATGEPVLRLSRMTAGIAAP